MAHHAVHLIGATVNVVEHMAGAATFGRAPVTRIGVALGTRRLEMLPLKRKLRGPMVEERRAPTIGAVALSAIGGECTVVGVASVMAGTAFGRGVSMLCRRGMTVRARQAAVGALEQEIGCRMVEGQRIKRGDVGRAAFMIAMAGAARRLLFGNHTRVKALS